MTKGLIGKEPDPRTVYADIIDLPRHRSDHHPPMSLRDRAAQFAPYAALTGYHDLIAEEARQVDRRIEPEGETLEALNRNLDLLNRKAISGGRPAVSVTYFVPDPVKDGGRYETATACLRKIDPVRQVVILDREAGISASRMEIRIADILDIGERQENF